MSGTRFVHLHNHSEYSLLDGAQRIGDMIERAKALDMPAVALTDHGNMFGAVRFYDAAMARDVKPIIGCEIYVAPRSRFEKSPGAGGRKPYYHLLLLAENQVGFQNLIKLSSRGYLEGFYYRPRIDRELLAEYREGLICASACLAGEVPTMLRHDDYESARRAAEEHVRIFGDGNYFLELQDHGIPEQKKVNEGLVSLHRELGIPLIATNDCHFLTRDDHGAHDVLICIGTGKKRGEEKKMAYQTEHFFKSGDEMAELFGALPEALSNTCAIAERCEVSLDRKTHHLPAYPVEQGETLDSTFVKEARAGFERRRELWERRLADGTLRHPLSDYETRLETEIETIVQMGFSGYFLIVSDFIRYAREQGIPVGPGRGSAAGSLVAFCLWITDIDPLQYDLIFERFLNPERVTMPDIDIDFCFRRRSEVIDYVIRKYGRENVAQIITFGTMAARAALRDAGRVLDMPYNDVDKIAKLVPEEIGTRLQDAIDQVPQLARLRDEDDAVRELLDIALRLEGLSRHASTHAAGVVITPEPVTEFAPLFKSNKDEITTQWAKNEIESVGLLKMDFLGLKTLTLITDTLDLIRKTEGEAPDLDRLPLDDEKTFALFARGDTTGVFQFESFGMRDILRRLGPERFEDLIALNALYRPGPLGSGMIEDFIQRRHGKVEVNYPHPATEPILAETYGVIVYQEQVMKIASVLGGYTLGQADLLRRAMGKKKKEAMDRERVRFLEGARERNVGKADAERIFDLMAKFAGYGFNKSHSAAYALVAYQTAWLKTHYPLHFMAALLTSEKDHTDKLATYITELRESGVRIDAPSVNESARYFEVRDGGILFGLAAIKGIGEGAVDAIVEARERIGGFKSLDDVCCEVDRRALNRKVLESLIKSGAMDGIGERSRLFAAIDAALERGTRVAEDRASGQVSLFEGDAAEAAPDALPLPDVPPWEGRERLNGEKEALGLYLSGHPLDEHRERLDEVTTHEIRDMGGAQEVVVGGLITGLRRRRTRSGEWMARFSLEDTTGHVPCVVFPRLYREIGEGLDDEQAVVVSGRAEGEGEGDLQLLAEKVVPLDQAQARTVDGVTVRLVADRVREGQLDRIAEILADHPGATPVYFEVIRPGVFRVVLQAAEERGVKAERALIAALAEVLGQGGARLGRPA